MNIIFTFNFLISHLLPVKLLRKGRETNIVPRFFSYHFFLRKLKLLWPELSFFGGGMVKMKVKQKGIEKVRFMLALS